MSSDRFDELARTLAQPMPRRRALRLGAGMVLAAAFPWLRPGPAGAAPEQDCAGRNELCPTAGHVNCGHSTAGQTGACCCYCCATAEECGGDGGFCCPPALRCADTCCNPGEICRLDMRVLPGGAAVRRQLLPRGPDLRGRRVRTVRRGAALRVQVLRRRTGLCGPVARAVLRQGLEGLQGGPERRRQVLPARGRVLLQPQHEDHSVLRQAEAVLQQPRHLRMPPRRALPVQVLRPPRALLQGQVLPEGGGQLRRPLLQEAVLQRRVLWPRQVLLR